MRLMRTLFRFLFTALIVGIALVLSVTLWREYMIAPWTRDAKVRVEVVDVAPEVAGTVVAVNVVDNQFVHKGDPLFQIDPIRFQLAIAQAKASLEAREAELELKKSDAKRRIGLAGVVSAEEQERYQNAVDVAIAARDQARAELDVAKLNLHRSTLYAPANGWVTNMRLRVGDYVTAGAPRVAVVDADSFWIAGYFEETKLSHISVGDKAHIKLMGFTPKLTGHVETIYRGITDPNGAPDRYGLPSVNPIFTWVRLAQRIPVRIHIDTVPEGVLLAAGETCSVAIGRETEPPNGPRGWLIHWLDDML
ncbi:MAG TPA: HlyD family secretion protein [Acetobacteraceae bacterium]|nr:HlyD family secretion protein [Acetobacteraceae bacterium]